LKYHAQIGQGFAGLLAVVESSDTDLARGGVIQAGNQREQRAFPGPVGA